ncbi:hypothetical protein ADL22_00740 [Streptomyces sp. NRRL F-4489]|uniref:hypothetical protein n=1 Tax=Streptomyces sp. NRRL F-4489 TaxID=1609095 RepID=UPI0007464241|nr:hypothetical protein [Streptomyces sp. NRRL F-4489]KUL55453.1 hypothetical protein ADL22_00740 [Streptomyces sp. NRRL F-4489]
MKRVVRAVPVALAAAAVSLVGLVGCSSGAGAGAGAGATKATGNGAGAQASAEAFARTYQEAVNDQDWQQVCRMRTDRYRHGTVQACVAANTESTPSATPSPTESEEPLRRADGSIVPPKPKPSASGPDRAETGPVKAAGAVPVPAIGEHPAGTGVGVQYTVTWPSSTTTDKKALRLVQQGGRWLVDQSEDVFPSDEAHGDPVRDALSRS